MKKLLAAIILSLALAGCGSEPPPNQPTIKSSADQTITPSPR